MDESGQPHCLFLEGQFAVGGGVSPSGIYDPTANVRTLQLGADHAAPTAQMASLHETFHAFLNASTTFGAAMILAGALADAGMSEFKDLVGRMVGGPAPCTRPTQPWPPSTPPPAAASIASSWRATGATTAISTPRRP